MNESVRCALALGAALVAAAPARADEPARVQRPLSLKKDVWCGTPRLERRRRIKVEAAPVVVASWRPQLVDAVVSKPDLGRSLRVRAGRWVRRSRDCLDATRPRDIDAAITFVDGRPIAVHVLGADPDVLRCLAEKLRATAAIGPSDGVVLVSFRIPRPTAAEPVDSPRD